MKPTDPRSRVPFCAMSTALVVASARSGRWSAMHVFPIRVDGEGGL